MADKRVDQVYLVVWPPPIGVLKVGYTAFKRYRAFTQRGAVLHELVKFPDSTTAFEFEDGAKLHLSRFLPRAFRNRTQATHLLGGSGGGFTECFTFGKEDEWLIAEPISSWTSGT